MCLLEQLYLHEFIFREGPTQVGKQLLKKKKTALYEES